MMLVYCDGRISGSLSSGCIEADIVQHALRALQTDTPIKLKYGANSSWIDLRLPCGGAIEVTIVPRPDAASFRNGILKLKRREPARLQLSKGDESFFQWQLNPPIKLMVFGTGQEALYTARLAIQFGVDYRPFTPEKTLLSHSQKLGILTSLLTTPKWRDSLPVDPWTAITLLFHDHDWEPPLLQSALASAAFYIGSQGSKSPIRKLLSNTSML